MKVGESRPVGGTAAVNRTRKSDTTESAGGFGKVEDSTSIMGIPEAEFTPKVRSAIMTLLAEVGSLRDEVERNKKRIAQLEKLADEDTLTPVSNRRAFVRELSRMLSYAERYEAPVSVLYFDINDMKLINDSYGHGAGDAVITQIAKIITENVRSSDIVGRLGGDEFGIILANAFEDAALQKADELVDATAANPVIWNNKKIPVTVTYGAYSFKGGKDALQVLEEADRAMYARKPTVNRRAG